MKKSELRKIYLANQKSLSDKERYEKSLQIQRRFFDKFDLSNIKTLHLFISIAKNSEVETAPFFEKIWQDYTDIKTIVPRVDFRKNLLTHHVYNSQIELATNRWGIAEPKLESFVDEREIDLVLVPLLCFDERGFRVGYGKGFYDKFLSLCREDCLKIGLSLFESVESIEDTNKFDVKLDHCITPERIWEF